MLQLKKFQPADIPEEQGEVREWDTIEGLVQEAQPDEPAGVLDADDAMRKSL